jgi:hypothetical protein
MTQSERTRQSWKKCKLELTSIGVYSENETIERLKAGNFYLQLKGKAKNRTLFKQDRKLYSSIYKYTQELEQVFKAQKSYKSTYSFYQRILFLVEYKKDLQRLKCSCGKKYTWNTYCRHCPDYKQNQLNKPHTAETKLKMRKSALEYIAQLKGQVVPRYNKDSIPIIEEYGKKHGYRFMHAENGGEYFVQELGYFLDAYDPVNNIVLEIDERHHFTQSGALKDRDQERQSQIEKLLDCKFIRIKYDRIL